MALPEVAAISLLRWFGPDTLRAPGDRTTGSSQTSPNTHFCRVNGLSLRAHNGKALQPALFLSGKKKQWDRGTEGRGEIERGDKNERKTSGGGSQSGG